MKGAEIGELAYRSLYCYAWDLAEAGVSSVADDLRSRHINTITLAGAYHAGKFLRPHGKNGKVYFPEDGTIYFKADQKRYGEIKPAENSLVADHDIIGECCALDTMNVQAWMVLLHNSRLGTQHPEHCVTNAFGDRYIYSLCPASPAVRKFAINLCADIADQYPIAGLSLETPGFLPYEHGYHHEFALVRQNNWLNDSLGLCFCTHCVAGAGQAGVDAERLKARTAAAIEAYFAHGIDYADDMAGAFWRADLVCDPDLHGFLNWRCAIVESLVREIRQAVRNDAAISVIPSVARPTSGAWYEGSDIARLCQAADALEVCFYEPGAARIAADLQDVVRRCGGADKLRGILRPGFPDLESRQAVIDAVAVLHAAGIEDIAFYNYGHLKTNNLDWMADALGEIAK